MTIKISDYRSAAPLRIVRFRNDHTAGRLCSQDQFIDRIDREPNPYACRRSTANAEGVEFENNSIDNRLIMLRPVAVPFEGESQSERLFVEHGGSVDVARSKHEKV